jgi:hypothetical protein
VSQDHWGKPLNNKLANFYTQGFFIFSQDFLLGNRVFLNKVTLSLGILSPPVPSFETVATLTLPSSYHWKAFEK